jgi:hypothetical protein
MRDYDGEKNFPIWLIGDSPPKNSEKLNTPLDWRHPTRHSIWTPIENVIQRLLYNWKKTRLLSENIYTINSINSVNFRKPKSLKQWKERIDNKGDELNLRINELKCLIDDYRGLHPSTPLILLTFGNFSYEMIRRSLRIGEPRNHSYWSQALLGEAFRKSISDFGTEKVNVFPLLHATIARRFFLDAHKNYCLNYEVIQKMNLGSFPQCKNYFYYVGYHLATILYENYAMDDPSKPQIYANPNSK